MTVKELITLLGKFEDDLPVVTRGNTMRDHLYHVDRVETCFFKEAKSKAYLIDITDKERDRDDLAIII